MGAPSNSNPRLNTSQALDQAVRNYRKHDLRGPELFRQWRAIRDASLALEMGPGDGDRIPGDDSY